MAKFDLKLIYAGAIAGIISAFLNAWHMSAHAMPYDMQFVLENVALFGVVGAIIGFAISKFKGK